jgi:hypothetical protein
MRLPVREALELSALNSERHTFTIRHLASVVTEFVLREIAVKIFLFAMLIYAVKTALEKPKEAFR